MIKVISTFDSEYQKVLSLRNQILRKSLGLDIQNDDLIAEEHQTIFAYFSDDGDVIGCLLVKSLDDARYQMRQMAVQDKFQRQGIGTLLIQHAEAYIARKGGLEVVIEARNSAIGFYQRNGYMSQTGEYMKLNIPHTLMIKQLIYDKK